MTSITLFLITISFTVVHTQRQVSAVIGSTCTLVGPENSPSVSWLRLRNSEWFTFCHLPVRKPSYSCDSQNLTLINITKNDEGYYYVYNNKNLHNIVYKLSVTIPTTPAPPKTRKTTRSIKTSKIDSSTIEVKLNKQALTFSQLQNLNDTVNSTLPALPNENRIPNSMIGIIVAVVMGMIIIIICMITYACCYRRFHYEEKGDPLLNFDI